MDNPVALMTPDPEADELRRRGLRRMRTVAVSLLIFAAIVYLATLERDGFWGFVNAGAEASMVGAIADWFAVTALFKHPMGLPIPHTALIPRRKSDLGRSLQDFVADNFLQEDIIRERVAIAQISQRIGTWLSSPANARKVVDEGSELTALALSKIRDDQVSEIVTEAIVPRLRDEPVAAMAGSLLQEVVRDDVHHGLVDLALTELYRWMEHNPDTFTEMLSQRAPWWAPERLNEVVTERIYMEAVRWLADIRDDPDHHARHALDSMLAQLADDLLTDPSTQERLERLKLRILDHPQVLDTSVAIWNSLRKAFVTSLRDPDGAVRTRVLQEISAYAARLTRDDKLRAQLDTLVADAVVFGVQRYGNEITAVITATVERWDGKEAARKIELHVGRDLQFIRINGTIVGGLVGLAIHTVAVLVH